MSLPTSPDNSSTPTSQLINNGAIFLTFIRGMSPKLVNLIAKTNIMSFYFFSIILSLFR